MSLGEKQCLNYVVYHYTTYCNLLYTINNSLPIEISLEKRSVESIWSCVNSENYVVKYYLSVSNKITTFCFWSEPPIFFI